MALTFNVDTSTAFNVTNGIFLGFGVFGTMEHRRALSDEDGDGVWSITLRVPIGLSGTYLYLNNPSSDTDMGTRENLDGYYHRYCATTSSRRRQKRILAPVTEDTVLDIDRFGECGSPDDKERTPGLGCRSPVAKKCKKLHLENEHSQ